MKIHEYQAKQLLKEASVPVPDGCLAASADEAAAAFARLAAPLAVVKAQVHAGGRGKGGGIKLVRSRDEARRRATDILSKPLVTPQTGLEGRKVTKLWVERGTDIARELYVGMVIDRAAAAPALMLSSEGGVEIEEVAARSPEKILRVHIDAGEGLRSFQARKLAYA